MEINYIHTEDIHNTISAGQILPYLFKIINPGSVVDVGCGTGSWLKVAKQLGASQILGIDGIHVDKNMLCIEDTEFFQHDLTLPLAIKNKYDLAICLEVAEHLPHEVAENIIKTLTGFSDIILFAAAIPGQGGQFHLNEQWPAYWQKHFATHHYQPFDILRAHFWGNAEIEWWYKQNMLLYIKTGSELVYNLAPVKTIPAIIHPELLNHKLEIIESLKGENEYKDRMIYEKITNAGILYSLKRLIRSFIKQ